MSIVVGSDGFAGTTLTRGLDRSLPPGWQPLLISEQNSTTFCPMLP
jgi:NADH dehydrogenase FAD-containing subunit